MEATMSATEADVYAKKHLLLVNGVCFDDSMSGAGVQGDGAGVQGEEDESDGEENGLCHGLRHVPPNLRTSRPICAEQSWWRCGVSCFARRKTTRL